MSVRASSPQVQNFLSESLFRHRDVFRVQLDPDKVPMKLLCHIAGGSCAAEAIQNRSAYRTPSNHTRLDQLRRKRGKVRFWKRLRADCPYVAQVPLGDIPSAFGPVGPVLPQGLPRNFGASAGFTLETITAFPWHPWLITSTRSVFIGERKTGFPFVAVAGWMIANSGLFDRFVVVVVPLGFRQQENVLVAPRRAVSYAFRHRCWLRPDDVRPQIPPIRLKGKCHAPRNPYEVFWLQVGSVSASRFATSAIGGLLVPGLVVDCPLARVSVIRITEVKPERAIIAQNSTNLAEYFDKAKYIFFRRPLKSNLLIYSARTTVETYRSINARTNPGDDSPFRLIILDLTTYSMRAIGATSIPLAGSVIPQAPVRRACDAAMSGGSGIVRSTVKALPLWITFRLPFRTAFLPLGWVIIQDRIGDPVEFSRSLLHWAGAVLEAISPTTTVFVSAFLQFPL